MQVGATVDWNPAPNCSRRPKPPTSTASRSSRSPPPAQAIAASGLLADASLPRERIGVSWGTGMGGAHTQEASYQQVYGKGEWRVRPLTVVMGMTNAAGSNVAVRHGLRGPFANYSTACSSSAMALGEAMRTIAAGRADAMIAGGSEALLTPGVLVGVAGAAHARARRRRRPRGELQALRQAPRRPGARRRRGGVRARGGIARPRARRAHLRACSPATAIPATRCTCRAPTATARCARCSEALAEARLSPQDIGYINAHGTATAVGDVVEAEAINAVFGAAAREVRVSSTKSLHGHLLGGSGALEFAAALLALERASCRRPASSSSPIPACGLRHVARAAERVEPPRAVMSNSFAFGGSNVVLVAARA